MLIFSKIRIKSITRYRINSKVLAPCGPCAGWREGKAEAPSVFYCNAPHFIRVEYHISRHGIHGKVESGHEERRGARLCGAADAHGQLSSLRGSAKRAKQLM